MKLFWSTILNVLFSVLLVTSALAQDFLNDAQHMFFDESMFTRRFGIEIEFLGVPDKAIEQIIIDKLQAKPISRLANGEVTFETPYGEVKLKIEGQAWRYENDPVRLEQQIAIDLVSAPREIVFPPMTFKDVQAIQDVGVALREQGAVGTTDAVAVSTQVNVEMPLLIGQGNIENVAAVENLLNLMRVYSRKEHARQIEEKIHVPAIRREYIVDYSAGFLKRIAKATYKPTARELFDDYFYRQSLELLGFKKAWSMDLEKAKALLLSQPDPVVPKVAKMLRLRTSSLMLLAFPEDPLTKAIVGTRWARAMPLVEFREHNTDFDIRTTIEQCLGIVRSVEVFGDYDHDTLVSKLTGIDQRDLVLLRENAQILKGAPRIVRYALQDPKTSYLKGQNTAGQDTDYLWIQLSAENVGMRPLVVDGNSVVFNRRHIHRQTLLGKYNPGLENALIQQAMENKIFEARLLRKYAKGSLARSLTLAEVSEGKSLTFKRLLESLNVEFPNGWVMKGAWDLSTENMFISDKLDVLDLIRRYHQGFEEFKAKVEERLKGADPEEILSELKKHDGYRGWKIVELLAQPELVFFQERVRIVNEFRVEIQGGKVLSRGSTIDRYSYAKKRNAPKITPEQITAAEQFAQAIVDGFPDALRFLPYGFDVALLKNGTMKLVETNPGGNSSFLEEHEASMMALDDYLSRYPELVDAGKIKLLSATEQMEWLRQRFAEFQISTQTLYRGFQFLHDNIIDSGYPRVVLPRALCERLLVTK